MVSRQVVFIVSAISTTISAVTASIATSGQFEPATIAVVAGIGAGAAALTSFLALNSTKPES